MACLAGAGDGVVHRWPAAAFNQHIIKQLFCMGVRQHKDCQITFPLGLIHWSLFIIWLDCPPLFTKYVYNFHLSCMFFLPLKHHNPHPFLPGNIGDVRLAWSTLHVICCCCLLQRRMYVYLYEYSASYVTCVNTVTHFNSFISNCTTSKCQRFAGIWTVEHFIFGIE